MDNKLSASEWLDNKTLETLKEKLKSMSLQLPITFDEVVLNTTLERVSGKYLRNKRTVFTNAKLTYCSVSISKLCCFIFVFNYICQYRQPYRQIRQPWYFPPWNTSYLRFEGGEKPSYQFSFYKNDINNFKFSQNLQVKPI